MMTDNWNMPNNTEPTPDSTPVQEPTPNSTPVQEPVAPTEPAPAAPQVGPDWSSDGSYRYVPPRSQQPTPPYQQPWYNNANPQHGGYTPPQGGYTPPQGGYTPPKPPKKEGKGWIAAIAVLCAVAVIASVVVIVLGVMKLSGTSTENTPGTTHPTANPNAPTLEVEEWDTNDGGLSTEEIVLRNYDSTVVLTAYDRSGNAYFGQSNLTEVAAASGIVMEADGYIITNRHCVINEQTGVKYERIDVTTYDGTVYEDAAVIGADEATDLAVIKVEATNLVPAKFGNSDELAVGARVVALGNAAGLSWTATQGIVSAKAREVYEDTGYAIKCLQVDVAINSGNSGGPLLNKQGMVVGINSAKIAASGYEGLGFSIPINEAKVIIDSLLQYGYVQGRVALGITGRTYDSYQYKGFLIETIGNDSCFKNTAVREGDLIVEIDGVKVTDYGTLRYELSKHKVGDTVELKLLRSDLNGNITEIEVDVTLKEQTAQ